MPVSTPSVVHPRLALVALLLPLLAGCASAPPAAEEPALQAEAAAPRPLAFDPAQVAGPVGNAEKEAFLAVSPDGQTILACAHGDFRDPVLMLASTDGGASFRPLSGSGMLPSGDCFVALGPGGAWTFSGKTALGIDVVTTVDGGQTWVGSRLAGPPLNGLADRQWLAYVGETLLVSYQPGTQQVGSVLVTRSEDLGATWSQPVEVAAFDQGQPATHAGPFVVGPGAMEVRVPLQRSGLPTAVPGAEGPADLLFAVSHDAGATWDHAPVVQATVDAYPTGATVTADGTLAWAYFEGGAYRLVVSRDGGATWSTPVSVATGAAHERPWVSARPDGTIDLLWLSDGAAFDGAPGIAISRLDPIGGEPVVSSAIASDVDFIEFACVAHDGLGRAYVATILADRLIEMETGRTGEVLLIREALAPAPTA